MPLKVIRSDHSETFKAFHCAILDKKQVTCSYHGAFREICPHILVAIATESTRRWFFNSLARVQASCRQAANGDACTSRTFETSEFAKAGGAAEAAIVRRKNALKTSMSTSTQQSPTSRAAVETLG